MKNAIAALERAVFPATVAAICALCLLLAGLVTLRALTPPEVNFNEGWNDGHAAEPEDRCRQCGVTDHPRVPAPAGTDGQDRQHAARALNGVVCRNSAD
jgi:hypothetical protein